MFKSSILAVFVATTLAQQPAPTLAQAAAAASIERASTASECLQAAREFLPKRQREVRTPTGYTSELLNQVDQEKTAFVGRCVPPAGL